MQPFEFDLSHADAPLDTAIDDALTLVRDTEAAIAEIKENDEEYVVTTHDLERMKAYVTGHARTPEWQQVIERINAGELNWEHVVLDRGATDPGVAAAYASLVRVPPLDEAGMQQLVATFRVAIAEPTPDVTPEQEQPPKPDHSWQEDEEYYDGVQHWRAT